VDRTSPNGMVEMFVIYDHPKDYPGHFVVRRWFGTIATSDFAIANTIEEARAEVPDGLVRLPHQPGEDAVIAETWI
jgi:hypothetical protein